MEGEPAGLDISLDDLIRQTKPSRQTYRRRKQHSKTNDRSIHPSKGGDRGRPSFRTRKHIGQRKGPWPKRRPMHHATARAIVDGAGTVLVKAPDGNVCIRITPGGDITIDTGGKRNKTVFELLNRALNPVNIRVTKPGESFTENDWSISDGKSLRKFDDGLVLPGKMQFFRAQTILETVNTQEVAKMNKISHLPPPPPPEVRHAANSQAGSVFSRLG